MQHALFEKLDQKPGECNQAAQCDACNAALETNQDPSMLKLEILRRVWGKQGLLGYSEALATNLKQLPLTVLII